MQSRDTWGRAVDQIKDLMQKCQVTPVVSLLLKKGGENFARPFKLTAVVLGIPLDSRSCLFCAPITSYGTS